MVKVALISIEADVLAMLEAEAAARGYDIVYKEHVSSDNLDRASASALEVGADIVIGCCHKPIRNVYMGVPVPVIYVRYNASELERNLKAACMEVGCEPETAAFIAADIFLPGGLGAARTGLPRVIRVNESTDILAAVGRASEDGVQLILGGREVCDCASEAGISNVVFTFGEGDVRRAFDAASSEAEKIELRKHFSLELSAVMAGAFCGIIVVNRRGTITAINEYAGNFLGCSGKTVTGMYVLNVFQDLEKSVLDRVLDGGEQIYNHVVGTRKKRCTVGIEPVVEDGETVSCVISFQKLAAAETVDVPGGRTEQTSGVPLHSFGDFVYESDAFRNVIKNAKFASYTDVPILLMGEEGTEMLELAQSIHRESTRYSKPFYEVECNAWSQEHIDGLLFGRAGAPDGKCLVKSAEGGTIFLNHVDELSKELQFKVYKLITGYYASIDEMLMIPANVRIIASACKNLRELASADRFREDLYYALSVLSISVPPLRARMEDVACMVRAWTNHYSEIYMKPVYLKQGVYDCICEYRWPGNTRQLKHMCQKLVLTTPHRSVSEAFVRSEIEKLAKRTADDDLPSPPEQIPGEAARIIAALEKNRGNKAKTAEELGISKTTLWRKIQKYGITEAYH